MPELRTLASVRCGCRRCAMGGRRRRGRARYGGDAARPDPRLSEPRAIGRGLGRGSCRTNPPRNPLPQGEGESISLATRQSAARELPMRPDVREICRVYVHPSQHGTGLGASLARYCRSPCNRGRRGTARAVERHAVRSRAPVLRKAVLCARRTDPRAARHFELAGVRLRQAGERHRSARRRGGCIRRASPVRHPDRLRRRRCGRVVPAAARTGDRARLLETRHPRDRRRHPAIALRLGERRAGRHGHAACSARRPTRRIAPRCRSCWCIPTRAGMASRAP